MLPKYENGDIIVVYREQRHPLSSFYGEEAAVRLKTGERYLKTIERGKSPTSVNLTSFNAKPITGVKLEWIGEICVTLPRGQIERLRNKAAARARKATSDGRPHAGQIAIPPRFPNRLILSISATAPPPSRRRFLFFRIFT